MLNYVYSAKEKKTAVASGLFCINKFKCSLFLLILTYVLFRCSSS